MERTKREAEITTSFANGPHRIVEIGSHSVATYRFGRGPDLVCVHGWPLHGATFRRIIPELERHFTVHVLDLPGAGATASHESARHDFVSHARVVRAVIDALGLSRYALLGHDSGGAIARLVAAEDPRVAGIVLGNSEIPGQHPWQLKVMKAFSKLPGSPLLGSMRIGALRRGPLGFGGCFTDPAYGEGEFFELFFAPLLASREVAAGQMKLLDDYEDASTDALADAHARTAAPALLVWGDADTFFPIDRARAMCAQFPGGAEVVAIPGGKLLAHEDHAEVFAQHARSFLERAFAAPRAELRA